eukprot:TRINITY_DN12248_c0_g1_i1.p1 TRINITY_DN12248_c0_g1~~TRINITY_DN12248_c0_g1_i1.p1  ORF type:complete len:431 (+),score=47.27 TRINITY_DN12248_c0_g1_i1:41-1333(+)
MPVASVGLRNAVASLRSDPVAARGMKVAGKPIQRGEEKNIPSKRIETAFRRSNSGLDGAGFVAVPGIRDASLRSKRPSTTCEEHRRGRSGLSGGGMTSEIGYSPPTERSNSRKQSTSKQTTDLTGAAAHSLQRTRSASPGSHRAVWQQSGTAARDAMLQSDAPAPELLGKPTRSRSGRASTEHPKYQSPASSRGFGTVPVNPERPPTPRGRKRDATPPGTRDLLHHTPFRVRRSASPVTRQDSIISTGRGERPTHTKIRSVSNRPNDTLQSTMGVISNVRNEPISVKWKQSPKQLPSKPRPLVEHRPPPTPEPEKLRGKRTASPVFERTPSFSGLSRSHTPPRREYSIIAPRTVATTLHTAKMRSSSSGRDNLISQAQAGHGTWAPPVKSIPSRRPVATHNEASHRSSSKGYGAKSYLGHASASDIIAWR